MGRGDGRQALLVATEELLQERGYAGTGLNQIIARSGAPKGSLYHYFPGGKEELAAEAVRRSGDRIRDRIAAADASHPTSRLEAAVQVLAEELERSDFAAGCPLATTALEMSGQSERLRLACEAAYDRWLDLFQEAIESEGVPSEIARAAATFALSTIEGALLLCRVQRSRAPLDLTAAMLSTLYEEMAAGKLRPLG